MTDEVLMRVENVKKLFPVSASFINRALRKVSLFVTAVDDVSFQIGHREILGLCGESGCGKTTTGNMLLLLEKPTQGKITFQGTDITTLKGPELKAYRRHVQMIFQDPYESLNPRFTVYRTVEEPLRIHQIGSSKEERLRIVQDVLASAELTPHDDYAPRYPHELSGGERQRVAIARALVLRPSLLIADEPVSMLDVSLRSGALNTLLNLREKLGISILLITHDLSVLRHTADRIIVMYLGKIVEIGRRIDLFENPQHPYFKILLSAVPVPDPSYKRERVSIVGEPPNPIDIPKGCRFHPRCPSAKTICREKPPPVKEFEDGHLVWCHLFN